LRSLPNGLRLLCLPGRGCGRSGDRGSIGSRECGGGRVGVRLGGRLRRRALGRARAAVAAPFALAAVDVSTPCALAAALTPGPHEDSAPEMARCDVNFAEVEDMERTVRRREAFGSRRVRVHSGGSAAIRPTNRRRAIGIDRVPFYIARYVVWAAIVAVAVAALLLKLVRRSASAFKALRRFFLEVVRLDPPQVHLHGLGGGGQ
jgi:hypothetical protein